MATATQNPPQGPTQGPKPQQSSGAAAVPPAPAGVGPQDGDRPAPPSPRLRVGKFRLRAGTHVHDQLNWLPAARVRAYAEEAGVNPELPDDGTLRPGGLRAAVRASRVAERAWRAGNVVASPKPLSSRWPEQWERVGDEVPESPGVPTLAKTTDEIEESYTEAAEQRTIDAQVGDDLHRLDVGRLRELAYQEGIDLGTADNKAAVLAVIRRTRRAVAEDR